MQKVLFLLIIILNIGLPALAEEVPPVSAKSAILIEEKTGNILYEKNIYEKLPMASTTKIMTALVAIENTEPDKIVKVSQNAQGVEGSSVYLVKDEEITMQNLLYGLMLSSGNDAAVAIAEATSGSVESFVKLMNKKALAIGANSTSFANPNGLEDANHYTTAYDLALITKCALSNKELRTIVSTKEKVVPRLGVDNGRYLKNHNKLLWRYEGCTGVKTGFTKKAGRCLVSSAERDGKNLICVTINAPDDWNDHTKLLDYGFSKVELKNILKKNMVVRSIPVVNGSVDKVNLYIKEDFNFPDSENISFSFDIPKFIEAPVLSESKTGILNVKYKGSNVFSTNLYTKAPVPRVYKKRNLFVIISEIFNSWF